MFVATPLSPQTRRDALRAMADTPLDVLVIGAGVVGAGAALDAVTRGLSVGLVEARDLASGTSSRSSKLVHGGLRYLKQLDFKLVFEALRERKLILETLCPHLAHPVPFLYPVKGVFERLYVATGVGVYDLLGAGRGVPAHMKLVFRRGTRKTFRAARSDITGGILFYEGQLDDARHTMMLARTAADQGAFVAPSTRVVGFVREAGRIVGANVVDLETGQNLLIRARRIINAAGVWTDDIQQLSGGRRQFRVQASKGVHVLIPREKIDSDTGLITETEKSLLFIIPCPWSAEFWIVGTTDTAWNLDLAHPAATSTDIDYVLEQANALLHEPLTRADVVGVYAGLRPLLAGESDETSKLSREHAVASPAPGLVVVAGGKYTTYRVMAKDAVDRAVEDFPHPVAPSCTEKMPLVGAPGYGGLVRNADRLARQSGLNEATVHRLLGRYGTAIREVLAEIEAQPDLGEPLTGAPQYLRAEVSYAVSHEGALHLDDVLTRRTRISIDTPDRGVVAAEHVAMLVAPLLGWSPTEIEGEVTHYRSRVAAEIESQLQADDRTADAARLGAPDVRHSV